MLCTIPNATAVSSPVAIKLKMAIRMTSTIPQGGSSARAVFGSGSEISAPVGGNGSKGEFGVRDTEIESTRKGKDRKFASGNTRLGALGYRRLLLARSEVWGF